MTVNLTVLFDGFGGVNIGAQAAGVTVITGIENDPDIAAVAASNLDHEIVVADILEVNPKDFQPTWGIHASPECPNFSQAKNGAKESDLDIALASKVAEFIKVMQPEVFTLENVYMYRKSISWALIRNTLHEEGYWLDLAHINAADFGVPQTRKRMIVRAWKKGFLPPLPPPEKWVGWYEAIEDLIPDLPESQFADWQLARMPDELAKRDDFLIGQGYRSRVTNKGDPAFTITSNHNQLGIRAFLIDCANSGANARQKNRNPNQPSQTLTTGSGQLKAFIMGGGGNTNFKDAKPGKGMRDAEQPSQSITTLDKGGSMPRAWLSEGNIVSMTPRALARFQSFPDWYELPDNKTLACKGIGNAVPPLLYEKLIRQIMEAA